MERMQQSMEAAPVSGRRFSQYRDIHRGQNVVVCGCGPSLALLNHPERWLTIGVNDVGRSFTPDYLVVLNERRQFAQGRFAYVERSRARAVFTQLPRLDLPFTRVVRFALGVRGGCERGNDDTLRYSNNSPYVAVQLARHLGATRIGVIGVDFADDHFFGATGRHPLSDQLPQIDREYAALAHAYRADGVELFNLSPMSRLTALPRMSFSDWTTLTAPPRVADTSSSPLAQRHHDRRVFFVHYRFLSCGDVFETGLRDAAAQLGLTHAHGYWDDVQLARDIECFDPELIFVVHGRRFVRHWGDRFTRYHSAVWLLDEPYEVDDTSSWSHHFDLVFVNDPSTLDRHRNAHLLPVAYAPSLHHGDAAGPRTQRTGFVGGANPRREAMLAHLARLGLIDHVAGGPWRDECLRALCLAPNLPAAQTAALYRQCAIVLNIFRDGHHFNRLRLPGQAMNPRIAEALACGALVVSEPRALLTTEVPELPVFRNEDEAVRLLRHFLTNPGERIDVQRACAARLTDATYAARLETVMDIALSGQNSRPARLPALSIDPRPLEGPPDWTDLGGVVHPIRGAWVIDPGLPRGPGFERGLASRARYDAVELSFDAQLDPGAVLLAKLHQEDQSDQTTNSYHLYAEQWRARLARHHHVFREVEPPRDDWVRWRLRYSRGLLSLWRDGHLVHQTFDRELTSGYAFIGAQGGAVRVRGLSLVALPSEQDALRTGSVEAETLREAETITPRLSIVTTVYDRVECLRRCIASVQRLHFNNYEHLIVADHPEAGTLDLLSEVVASAADARIGFHNLKSRHDDWGIAPAAAGLRRARGEFVAFLSDDNGYLPDHFQPLITTLERAPELGFVYSSCHYDGRYVLAHPVPRLGRIDLGQPLFRRSLFSRYLNDELPFNAMAWDWQLVDGFIRRGVRWRHVNRPTFIFRLAKYQQFVGN